MQFDFMFPLKYTLVNKVYKGSSRAMCIIMRKQGLLQYMKWYDLQNGRSLHLHQGCLLSDNAVVMSGQKC